jgi:hypothetical protein
MRIAKWGLMILLVSPLESASARQPQQQAPPPLEQKQEKDQKKDQKKDQGKAAKVWDNDNISTTTGVVNVVGQPGKASTAAGEQSASAPAPEKEQTSGAAAADKSAIEGNLNAAKENLQNLKTALDILQRRYTLDQQSYYGTTNYASDKAGAAALKTEKDQVDAKQQEVAAAQKKVDDLQAKLNAASREKPSTSK